MARREQLLAEAASCRHRAQAAKGQAASGRISAKALGRFALELPAELVTAAELAQVNEATRAKLGDLVGRMCMSRARAYDDDAAAALGEARALEQQASRLDELAGPAAGRKGNGTSPTRRKATRRPPRGTS